MNQRRTAGYRKMQFNALLTAVLTLFTVSASIAQVNRTNPWDPIPMFGWHTPTGMDLRILSADEPQPLDLQIAINIALANNPEIRKALLSVDDARQQVLQAWAQVMPEVTSSASYTRNIEIPVNFVPAIFFDSNAGPDELVALSFGTDNSWLGGITVTQNLFKGDAFVGVSTSELYKTAQQDLYRAISQQTVTQIRLAYYNVLLAKENYRVLETSLRRLEELLRQNQVRKQAGLADDYDVLRIEVQLANQRPLLRQAENLIAQARREFNLLMGIDFGVDFEFKGNLLDYEIGAEVQSNEENQILASVDMFSGMNAADVQVEDFKNRGDIKAIESQIALRDKQILAYRSRFLPSVSAVYNLQWTASQPGNPVFFDNAVRFQTLGVNAQFPLFQGLQRVSEINRVQIQKKSFQTDLDNVYETAVADWTSALEELTRIFDTVQARKLAIRQANEGYRIATKRLESGVGSQIDVTDAELQVREAEFNYVQLAYDYLATKAQIDLTAGMVPLIQPTKTR